MAIPEDELDDMGAEIRLPKAAVRWLISELKLKRGALNVLLGLPGTGKESEAIGWWEGLTLDGQKAFQTILGTLAAPVLLADVNLMLEDELVIAVRSIATGKQADSPLLLMGTDEATKEYMLRQVETRDILVDTLLAYLDQEMPLWDLEFYFELPMKDMIVLLASIDHYRSLRYTALMTHEPDLPYLTVEGIHSQMKDAMDNFDSRWTLPFFLTILLEPFNSIEAQAIDDSVKNLIEMGLMISTDVEGVVGFTDPGHILASSVYRRIGQLSIQTAGATPEGEVATRGSVFIRGGECLWFINLGGETDDSVSILSINLDTARALLDELLTPTGVPLPLTKEATIREREAAEKMETPPPEKPPARKKAPAKKPPPPPKAKPKSITCPECEATLKPGAKFCKKCGASVKKSKRKGELTFCPGCGAKLKPGKVFCGKCGEPVQH